MTKGRWFIIPTNRELIKARGHVFLGHRYCLFPDDIWASTPTCSKTAAQRCRLSDVTQGSFLQILCLSRLSLTSRGSCQRIPPWTSCKTLPFLLPAYCMKVAQGLAGCCKSWIWSSLSSRMPFPQTVCGVCAVAAVFASFCSLGFFFVLLCSVFVAA